MQKNTQKVGKACACFRTVRKAVKHHFHSLKTKVCPRVPDREQSQEHTQTPIQELTAASGQLGSQPTDCESPVITALIHAPVSGFIANRRYGVY